MSKNQQSASSGSSNEVKNSSIDILIAKYGLIGTISGSIIGVIGVLLTAYFGYLGIQTQIEAPIKVTQTAEAKLTLVAQTISPNINDAQAQTYAKSATANANTSLNCSLSLGIPITPIPPTKDDKAQITSLIETEAEAVLTRDVNRVMSIFAENAKVVDSSTNMVSEGCESIRYRYENLLTDVTFTVLKYEIVELDIVADHATVKTLTKGIFVSKLGPYPDTARSIEGEGTWIFSKDQGVWQVHTIFHNFLQ